jgi:hypothetical protein
MTSGTLATQSNKRWIGFNVYDTQLLMEDEEDDGIDHTMNNRDDLGAECDDGSSSEILPGKQLLTFLLARLLGVKLTLQQLRDTASDVVLSTADVHFLTRFLIPGGSEDVARRLRDALDCLLPRSLNGIVDVLLEGRSERAVENLARRLRRRRAVDVFLTHDWPAGVIANGEELFGSDAAGSRPVGNPKCRELLESLKPTLHCCGHMHRGYRQKIEHKTPSENPSGKSTKLCCLGRVGSLGPAAIAVFELDLGSGDIAEIGREPGLDG